MSCIGRPPTNGLHPKTSDLKGEFTRKSVILCRARELLSRRPRQEVDMLNANAYGRFRIATCVTALALGSYGLTPNDCLAQAPAAAEKAAPAASAAAEAAKASPDLVGALSKELGSSPAQAAGAAGSLFGIAKSRLKAEEFGQI